MRKTSFKWLYLGLSVGMAACTSTIRESIPGTEVMHFPFSMALKDHTLVMSSQCSDHKYSFGRLVAIDTNAVESALSKARAFGPLPYAEVVTANTLIARDVGLLGIDGHIVFASRENQGLYAVKRDATGFRCADPAKNLGECDDASNLTLQGLDPYSTVVIADNSQNEHILATYLASDRLDIVNLDKTKKGNALSLQKTFVASDMIREKLGERALKNARFITRKAVLINGQNPTTAKVYVLIEKYDDKNTSLQNSKGAYILAVPARDLLSQDRIEALDLWDLSERYNINGALDFYVDAKEEGALVLARDPESLFKIEFNDRSRFSHEPLCFGASMLAVTPASDRVFVPCYSDNKVVSYKASSLYLEAVSSYHGRGPAFIAIDDTHKKIFVSYNNDGKVVIFDFDLAYQGHIFNEAPSDRIGS